MPWVYLDDQFPDHPKVVRAGGEAAWMYVCGLAYAKRYGTKGAIPADQVSRLTTFKSPAKLSERLVTERLWEKTPDGFLVHDYEDWNQPAESRSEAGRKAAHARWHGNRNANADANADANAGNRIVDRNATASEPHMPQDALSLSPNPRPKDLGCETTDLESVSNVPRSSAHEPPSTTKHPLDLVADLAARKAMP